MKTWKLLGLGLSCLAAALSTPLQANDILLEAKVGYSIPTNSDARDLYNDNARYELEGSVQICKCIYGFASASYFYSCGKTIGLEDRLSLDIVTIGAGLKYLYTFNRRCDAFYIGLGVLPTYVSVSDHSPFLHHSTNDWTVGGIVKGGFIFNLSRCVFVDAFIDYSIVRAEGKDMTDPLVYAQKTTLDAVTLGLGLGYRF